MYEYKYKLLKQHDILSLMALAINMTLTTSMAWIITMTGMKIKSNEIKKTNTSKTLSK